MGPSAGACATLITVVLKWVWLEAFLCHTAYISVKCAMAQYSYIFSYHHFLQGEVIDSSALASRGCAGARSLFVSLSVCLCSIS